MSRLLDAVTYYSRGKMTHHTVFILVFALCLIFCSQNAVYAQENGNGKKEPPTSQDGRHTSGSVLGEGIVDLNDIPGSRESDSLWQNFKGFGRTGKTNLTMERAIENMPVGALPDASALSDDYNPKAYPHLKNMARYCNQQWKSQGCLKRLSSLGIDLIKDYMKKIHYSKTVSADMKGPVQKVLKESCAGIIVGNREEVIPMVMSDNLKKCVNAVTMVNDMVKEKPDRDLRQLTLSSTFCIIRQPQCNMIEGQLSLIARPVAASAAEQIAPSK